VGSTATLGPELAHSLHALRQLAGLVVVRGLFLGKVVSLAALRGFEARSNEGPVLPTDNLEKHRVTRVSGGKMMPGSSSRKRSVGRPIALRYVGDMGRTL